MKRPLSVLREAGMIAPAASNIGIVAALIWWRKPRNAAESLPAERLVSAVRAGVRHVANNSYLRATLIRVLAFFPFASAYLALLPPQASEKRREFDLPEVSFVVNIKYLIRRGARWIRTTDMSSRTA